MQGILNKVTGALASPIGIPKALIRPLSANKSTSAARILLPLLLVVGATWFITVPVHELLHALGCILTGGKVQELTIRPEYGGGILEKLFGFVKSGGDYAGQLKEFDTYGSDFCYFTTVAFPFILTLIFGVPLLKVAGRNGHPIAFGVGIVHTFLPLASATGDYYEMGSILITGLLGFAPGSKQASLIRGDDIFLVFARVSESGIHNGLVLVTAGLAVGLILVWLTWMLSILFSSTIAHSQQ